MSFRFAATSVVLATLWTTALTTRQIESIALKACVFAALACLFSGVTWTASHPFIDSLPRRTVIVFLSVVAVSLAIPLVHATLVLAWLDASGNESFLVENEIVPAQVCIGRLAHEEYTGVGVHCDNDGAHRMLKYHQARHLRRSVTLDPAVTYVTDALDEFKAECRTQSAARASCSGVPWGNVEKSKDTCTVQCVSALPNPGTCFQHCLEAQLGLAPGDLR